MQANANPKTVIEDLKAAGEELKKTERKTPSVESGKDFPKDRISFQFCQKEILQEKQKLERALKEIETRQRKIQERLKIINELENQSKKLEKALESFPQKIVSIKKENNTILDQIKYEQ